MELTERMRELDFIDKGSLCFESEDQRFTVRMQYPTYSTSRFAQITTYRPYQQQDTGHYSWSVVEELFNDIEQVLANMGYGVALSRLRLRKLHLLTDD